MRTFYAKALPALLLGTVIISFTASAQAPEQAQLQVPMGQIEAFCDDYRQALQQCVTEGGVAVATTEPLTDEQIVARRECRQQVQDEFDLHTAGFCPGPRVSLAAADFAAMCVELNERTLPCLRDLGYDALAGEPLTPEQHAHLHHCREQADADMAVANRCGPPAYRHAP